MIDRMFTLPELASLVGVEYRTLHTWVRRGLLAASGQQAQGSGTRNLFDRHDALEAFVVADLRRAGIELSKLDAVANALRQTRSERDPVDEVLLINGKVSLSTYSRLAEGVRTGPTFVYALENAWDALGRQLAPLSE